MNTASEPSTTSPSEETVSTGTAGVTLIATVNDAVCAGEALSVAVTVNDFCANTADVVPEIAPVEASNVTPAGSCDAAGEIA